MTTNATDFTALAEAVRGRVDELQRLCDAATTGPWYADGQVLWVVDIEEYTEAVCCGRGEHECCQNPVPERALKQVQKQIGAADAEDAALAATFCTLAPGLVAQWRGLPQRYDEAVAAEDRNADPFGAGKQRGTLDALRTELAELAALLEVGI